MDEGTRATAPSGQRWRLSYGQERLWFLDQWAPGLTVYNVALAVRLIGPLRRRELERALNEVVRRHEVLRTVYESEGGVPWQVVREWEARELVVRDLRDLGDGQRAAEVERESREEGERPFDLETGPVLRWRLLRCGDEEHVLLLTAHHIALDGWSVGILMQEVGELYGAAVEGRAARLSDPPLQYGDYSRWHREWMSGGELERQKRYWVDRLRGMATLEMPHDRARSASPAYSGATHSSDLDGDLGRRLKELAKRERTSLFVVLLAGFAALLGRYSGQDDVVVGSAFAGRPRPELERLIGFFVNMLVLRVDLAGNPTFRELLGRARRVVLEGLAHQDMPFEKLVDELKPERDPSRNPLFQVSLNMVPSDLRQADPANLRLAGLETEALPAAVPVSRFDLSFNTIEQPDDRIELWIEYSTELFDADRIERMVGHYRRLLEAVVAAPETPLPAVSLLTEAEREQLDAWNRTAADYPRDATVHGLVEAQVAARPDSVAMRWEGQDVTYGDLNRRANRLAHHLRSAGVGPETTVGVCLERSPDLVVALLGVLKAGGAYVPLDHRHPARWLEHLVRELTPPALVVTTSALSARLPAGARPVLVDGADVATRPDENPAPLARPDNLAYVIYTSGSTGRPKGVLIQHASVVNFVVNTARLFEITPDDRFLQFAAFTFDVSVFEVFTALTSGARLCLIRQETLESLVDLSRTMEDERITVIDVAPAVMDLLPAGVFTTLRIVFVGGEAFSGDLVNRWNVPGRRFFNGYGPTETTVTVIAYECERRAYRESPPIGRAMANHQARVLDRHGDLAAIGVPGEICVGGAGLARGYLGQPGLTADRFVPDASGAPGSRLYRTGDLGHLRADGDIEFLGRVDQQVKIRGLRIELEEIESVLNAHPGIRSAVVDVREGPSGDRRLVAYVVAEPGRALAASELRDHVGEALPAYMVPASVVLMSELPLTSSGKVNRSALPEPDLEAEQAAEGYVAPRTETERLLANQIFSAVLGRERVGVQDNFVDLGGNSLQATQVVARIRDTFRSSGITLRALYGASSIEDLARLIGDAPA